ncbi:hypothetical protein [Azospirillum isscasi]|uniref:hypothetical protein n=1 Tax=Azospirillum isscasi TaxID=3053926 RepID=UPI0027D2A253|nr:hypothetical protein [Azospirillum isscasi]
MKKSPQPPQWQEFFQSVALRRQYERRMQRTFVFSYCHQGNLNMLPPAQPAKVAKISPNFYEITMHPITRIAGCDSMAPLTANRRRPDSGAPARPFLARQNPLGQKARWAKTGECGLRDFQLAP